MKLFELVTGTEMKPWLSRNMLPNINTCENGWLNFSANLRVVSLKLLELTQFAWQNLSIYLNFLCAVPRDDVTESTRFLVRLNSGLVYWPAVRGLLFPSVVLIVDWFIGLPCAACDCNVAAFPRYMKILHDVKRNSFHCINFEEKIVALAGVNYFLEK